MDFRNRVESFEEADRRYAELVRKRDAGEIGGDEFEEEARQLMVRDGAGRWWAKVGESGGWHYRDGGDWKPGTPPGHGDGIPRQTTEVVASKPPPSGGERKRRRIPAWIPIVALLGILLLVGVVAATSLVPLLRGDSGGEGEPMGVGGGGQEEEAGQDGGSEGGSGGGAAFEDIFVHRATPENISANSTFIDNPLTNGNPDAVLIVTQNWNPGGGGGTYNDHEVGVWYEGDRGQWAIFNQDRDPMTEDAAFNVAVR